MRCLQELSQYVFLLAVWHLAFFARFYKNPNLLATSEILSTFYPHWVWIGRTLKNLKLPFRDDIYYKYPACIPFLSTFYPPYFLTALIGKYRLYVVLILSHYFIGSLLAFFMLLQFFSPLVALVGAISLVYNKYCVKIYTPCFAFTHCWLMGVLIKGWLGAFCFGMALLGGYFPIILTFAPILLLNLSSLFGIVLALPQLIPFFWYLPKSCRMKNKYDPNVGKMPIKRFFVDLCFPENEVHYPELMFNVGLFSILWLIHPSIWWIFIAGAFLGTQGWFFIAHIPARYNYLLAFSLIIASLIAIRDSFSCLAIAVLQCFLLWSGRYNYPHFPFAQWWRNPKFYFSKFKKSVEWPYFSGYMFGKHQKWYQGEFRLGR